MDEPVAIDGSDGPLAVRRVVVWRRLEPGDVRTPGTELAPESPHLEAKVVPIGIAASLREDLERLWKTREEVTAIAHGWSTRYAPGGVLFALGGGMTVGAWLDFLPDLVLPFAGSLTALGAAIGALTRTLRKKREREATESWAKRPEREELERIERTLKPEWELFSSALKEQGFRTDVRVGDVHEADRLVSIDVGAIASPATWAPDAAENEVRYGWVYADGRIVEQVAELEDTEREPADATRARDRVEDDRALAPRPDDAADQDEDEDELDDANRSRARGRAK